MTDIVSPPAIDALPPAPAPTDTPAEFNAKGFATVGAQVAMVPQLNAANAATQQNATAANERAVASAASAAAATAQAGQALGYRDTAGSHAATATTQAGIATTKAGEAAASAVQASQLNLGDKAAPPTTDNQGQPLRAGATYFDTTLSKWRAWTGEAWGDGISAVAGVTSFRGRSGPIDDGVVEHIAAANSDLNTLIASGFYSFGTAANAPPGVTASQLIVSRGGATATQIVVDKATGTMHVRAVSALGTAPVWSAWRRVAMHADVVVPLAGGDIDCSKGNYFTETVSAARTLVFANIPGGSYNCVVEISHTAGAITLPVGAVWVGAAPTFTTGRRHLIFLQRAQSGAAGWYASALAGYAA